MSKLISALITALLAFAAFSVHAGLGRINPEEQAFRNNDGEYLIVKSNGNIDAYVAVTTAIIKAGYYTTSGIEPGTKTDTWCKVNVYQERQILGECYTPRMGFGISVRDDLAWTREQFKGDYSGVVTMIAKIRNEHRRASAFLKANSRSDEAVQYPLNEAPPVADRK